MSKNNLITGLYITIIGLLLIHSHHVMSQVKQLNVVVDDLYKTSETQQAKISHYNVIIDELEDELSNQRMKNEQIRLRLEQYKREIKEIKSQSSAFLMTHYTSKCEGCTGYTKAKSIDVRNTIYYMSRRVVAVDPSVVPLGSILEISDGTNSFKAQALDTGSKIKGKHIDLLVKGKKEALELGKEDVRVTVVREGW